MTMKLFVSGKNIFNIGVKHVVMPLAEKAELGVGLQSLGSLLPFVRRIEWLESAVEFGDDFNQHYTYNYDDYWATKVLDEEEEDDELIMEYCYSNSAPLMEVEEEEDDDELIMEYCCSNSADILTRVLNSVTCWSLLRELRLKESDIIGNAGSTIAQVSILKSLFALSHDDYCRRINPHLDVIRSFDSLRFASRGDRFRVYYKVDVNHSFPYEITNCLNLHYEGGNLWVDYGEWIPALQYRTISVSRKLG